MCKYFVECLQADVQICKEVSMCGCVAVLVEGCVCARVHSGRCTCGQDCWCRETRAKWAAVHLQVLLCVHTQEWACFLCMQAGGAVMQGFAAVGTVCVCECMYVRGCRSVCDGTDAQTVDT